MGSPDLRDTVVEFVHRWSKTTGLPAKAFVVWLGISLPKFYDLKRRYGQVNEHNGRFPCDHWLEPWEHPAILDFHERNPLEGYRRLAYMMIDADVVAVSTSSVYRVLAAAGRLDRWNPKTSAKARGSSSREPPHRHWQTDIAYVNFGGTFF